MKLTSLGFLTAAGLLTLWAGGDWRYAMAALQVQGGAGEIRVRDASQLQVALDRAQGGERIRLAPGSYGTVLIRDRQFARAITLIGGEGSERPRLDTLRISASRNVRVEGVEIGTDQPAGDGAYARIQDSRDIALVGSHVHGSLDGDPANDGVAVHVIGSTDVTLEKLEVEEAHVGVMVATSDTVRIAGNLLHRLRSDGIMSAGSDGVTITGNYITDFSPNAADHSDAIQFHNAGVPKGSDRLVIADNVIMQGKGGRMQGIWISDGQTFPHRNVTITNNLIYINDYYNGIGLNQVEGALVTDNTILSEPGDKETAWVRVRNASNIRLERNVGDYLFVQENVVGLTQADNLFFPKDGSPRCLFEGLGRGAVATIADLTMSDLGFRPGDRVHPRARVAKLATRGRTDVRGRCGLRVGEPNSGR